MTKAIGWPCRSTKEARGHLAGLLGRTHFRGAPQRKEYSLRAIPRRSFETQPPAWLATTSKSSVDRKILSLADEPRPAGCKKLKGYKDQWSILSTMPPSV